MFRIFTTSGFDTSTSAAIALTDLPAPCLARIFSRSTIVRFRPSTLPSRFAPQARNNPLRKSRMLLLRNRGEDRNYFVTEHSCVGEVLLCETLPRDTVAVESLQVLERLLRPFFAARSSDKKRRFSDGRESHYRHFAPRQSLAR